MTGAAWGAFSIWPHSLCGLPSSSASATKIVPSVSPLQTNGASAVVGDIPIEVDWQNGAFSFAEPHAAGWNAASAGCLHSA